MLISFKEINNNYNLNIQNILHIGAHKAEESNDYFANGTKRVIWIEANPDLAELLKNSLESGKNIILNDVVSDKDNEEVSFMITNNGQSSSILELGTHKHLFPDVYVNKQITLFTKRVDTIFNNNKLKFEEIDFINLDIQGAELLALKGINDFKNVKAIFTEINTEHVYKNCALVEEIDEYLLKFGFIRKETKMWENHPWGDALYIKC